MEKVLGHLLQGLPSAIAIGIALIFFNRPVGNRIDRIVDVMTARAAKLYDGESRVCVVSERGNGD